MLTAWARRTFRVILEPIALFLHRLGLTPNALTIIGLILQGVVAVILALGYLLPAGVLLVFFSAFDSLDGTLARMTGQVSKFGAFLDATVDRYAEALVLFGLLIYSGERGDQTATYLIYASIVGSLLVSYTRAKAESLGISCTEGILTRAERVVLLAAGLIVAHWLPMALTVVLWILAIGTNLTALQRIWAVRKSTLLEREPDGGQPS
jgi:CDP-diacylglycerol--glycerol-3-phosphate 3-phosphatidyltransferase